MTLSVAFGVLKFVNDLAIKNLLLKQISVLISVTRFSKNLSLGQHFKVGGETKRQIL